MTLDEKLAVLIAELTASSSCMMDAIIDLDVNSELIARKTLADGRSRINIALAEIGAA